MNKPKIVFFGTGPVSLMCLRGIYESFDIEAIITKPDRVIHGKAHDHPVKAWGLEHKILVHQVANKHQLSQLFSHKKFASQIGLVVDFGIIIGDDVIDYFPYKIVNSHFSLLPEWRGADPISFALLSGQKTTGVSIMLIVPAMDEGDLIAQEPLNIPIGATGHTLAEDLSQLSNRMLIDTLPRYLASEITPWPQEASKPTTYSRKLTKADGIIDWTKPAEQIDREIRTFLGWPGSRTQLFGKDVIITSAHTLALSSRPKWRDLSDKSLEQARDDSKNTGEILNIKDAIVIVCGKSTFLQIDRLKPSGKSEMAAGDFARGHHQK